MGDPVTMAMIGGSIGAMTNKRDPLKGALIGAAGGYAGGALMGAGTAGAAGTASTAGATQAANIATNPALSMGAANTAAGSAMTASPSLFSQAAGGLKSIGTWANQNPVAAGIGLQTAGSLLTPPPQVEMAAPPGLMRGQQFQTEQPIYAMAPQQPISLI